MALHNNWWRRNEVVIWSKIVDNSKLVHKVGRVFSNIETTLNHDQ